MSVAPEIICHTINSQPGKTYDSDDNDYHFNRVNTENISAEIENVLYNQTGPINNNVAARDNRNHCPSVDL